MFTAGKGLYAPLGPRHGEVQNTEICIIVLRVCRTPNKSLSTLHRHLALTLLPSEVPGNPKKLTQPPFSLVQHTFRDFPALCWFRWRHKPCRYNYLILILTLTLYTWTRYIFFSSPHDYPGCFLLRSVRYDASYILHESLMTSYR